MTGFILSSEDYMELEVEVDRDLLFNNKFTYWAGWYLTFRKKKHPEMRKGPDILILIYFHVTGILGLLYLEVLLFFVRHFCDNYDPYDY